MPKKISRKGLKQKLDDLWSDIIIARDKECQKCASTKNLQAHHIFGRSSLALRYCIEGGICLCANDHTFDAEAAHGPASHRFNWKQLYIDRRFKDEENYDNIYYLKNKLKSYSTMKDLLELREVFREILKEEER